MSKLQLTSLVLLRVVIGWHFMYEGMVKLLTPNWTSALYLEDSQGLFRDFFVGLSSNSSTVELINTLNMYGLLLIGFALIVGAFSKLASIGGILMLALYTMSHPATIGATYAMPMEGSYLWIDKNIIEMVALFALLVFPTSKIVGLDYFLKNKLGKVL